MYSRQQACPMLKNVRLREPEECLLKVCDYTPLGVPYLLFPLRINQKQKQQ